MGNQTRIATGDGGAGNAVGGPSSARQSSVAKRRTPWQSVVRRSQMRAVPSIDADVKMSSFGDISTDTSLSVCARKARRYRLSCSDMYRMA